MATEAEKAWAGAFAEIQRSLDESAAFMATLQFLLVRRGVIDVAEFERVRAAVLADLDQTRAANFQRVRDMIGEDWPNTKGG